MTSIGDLHERTNDRTERNEHTERERTATREREREEAEMNSTQQSTQNNDAVASATASAFGLWWWWRRRQRCLWYWDCLCLCIGRQRRGAFQRTNSMDDDGPSRQMQLHALTVCAGSRLLWRADGHNSAHSRSTSAYLAAAANRTKWSTTMERAAFARHKPKLKAATGAMALPLPLSSLSRPVS